MMDKIKDLNKRGKTVLMITHSIYLGASDGYFTLCRMRK